MRASGALIATGVIDGKDGNNGNDGTSVYVRSTSVMYATTISYTAPSTLSEDKWSATYPTSLAEGTWIHTRTIVVYSDGKSTTTYTSAYVGKNGTDAFVIDLTNQADIFGTDSTGKTLTDQVRTTKVHIYLGAAKQTLTANPTVSLVYASSGSAVPSSVAEATTLSGNGTTEGTVSITIHSNQTITDSIYVDITATCAKGSPKARFTLAPQKSGAAGVSPEIWQIWPDKDAVSFRRDSDGTTLTPSSISVTFNVKKTVGTEVTKYTSQQSGVYMKGYYSSSSSKATIQVGGNVNISNSAYENNSSFIVELYVNNVLCDTETIPILVDGKKGNDGQSITGKAGKMCYIAGEYRSTLTYVSNDKQTVAVEMPQGDGTSEIWYLTAATNVVDGIHYAPKDGSPYWEKGLNSFNLIKTEYLFANFASLGKFIVSGDWFFSQYGTLVDIDGNETEIDTDEKAEDLYDGAVPYMYFDSGDPMAEDYPADYYKFRPTLALDAMTGKIYALSAHIKGYVVVKSGIIDLVNTKVILTNGGSQETLIESGRIKTSLLNADQILANAIKGKMIDAENATINNLNVVTGTFNNINVSGIIKASLIYEKTQTYSGQGDFIITPSFNNPGSFCFIPNAGSSITVYLPKASDYDGLELKLFCKYNNGGGVSVRRAIDSNDYIYSREFVLVNTSETGGYEYAEVPLAGGALKRSTVASLGLNQQVIFKSIDGDWYVISGRVSGNTA